MKNIKYDLIADCHKAKENRVWNAIVAFVVGGFIGLKTDIEFNYSPLTHDSALNVIDNLAVSSGHKVIFKRSTFDTLTPAEIAKATSKGWTIEGL